MADAPVRRRGRVLLFVHIPKTAGTTLRTVLGMSYPATRSLALPNVFKGGGGISKGAIDRLRTGKGSDLRGVELIRGHLPLGIREYLPSYLPKGREVEGLTLLREPTERTLSHYFAVREDGGGTGGLPPLPPDASLEDALERGYLYDNVQTRMLSGLPEPFGEVDEEMLEQAKHNLRHNLIFFGLTERFDESLVLARRRLGLRSILYRSSDRVNTTRPRGEEVPADMRRTAERANRHDMELYRYAEELFDGIGERHELDFQVELAALRAAKGAGDPDTPRPVGFSGSAGEWRLLIDANTALLRQEWNLAASGAKAAVARSRARKLGDEVKRLRSLPTDTRELQDEVKRLRATSARTAQRLKSATARARELEREVERLRSDNGTPPSRSRLRAGGKRG